MSTENHSSSTCIDARPVFAIPDSFDLRAIATDMDGTFLASGLRVLPSTLKAYRRAIAMGIPVIPSTGRVKEGLDEVLRASGLTSEVKLYPGVFLNGTTVYGKSGELIRTSSLRSTVVAQMVDYTRQVNERIMRESDWQENPFIHNARPEHGFAAVVDRTLKPCFVALAAYTCNGLAHEENNQLVDGIRQFKEGRMFPVDDLLSYHQRYPIYKLLFITHSGPLLIPLKREVEGMLGDDVSLTNGIPRILEIAPRGVDKSIGLVAVAEELGLSLQSFACLGDGDNDIGMLRACGYSIAMGNAQPSLKKLGHAVTHSNNEEGWGLAVHALLDHQENKERGWNGRECRRTTTGGHTNAVAVNLITGNSDDEKNESIMYSHTVLL